MDFFIERIIDRNYGELWGGGSVLCCENKNCFVLSSGKKIACSVS